MPDCYDIKQYRLNDVVEFISNIDRMEFDGDGLYLIIGLQSGVKLKTGWSQPKMITLLCDNGVCTANAKQIRPAKKITSEAVRERIEKASLPVYEGDEPW